MTQFFRDLPSRAKLILTSGALVVAATVMIATVFVQLLHIGDTVRLKRESAEIIRLCHVAENGLIRVNSQMRGILLTGNFAYMDTFLEGRDQFRTGTRDLMNHDLTAGQRRLLARAMHDGGEWQRDYGTRLVTMARTGAGRRAATRIVTAAGDRPRVTRITKLVAAVREIEESRIVLREQSQYRAIRLSFGALLIGGLALIGIAVFIGFVVSEAIARPLARLTRKLTRLAAETYDVTLAPHDLARKDEIGGIARSIEAFRVSGLRRVALEAETLSLREAVAHEVRDKAARSAQESERDRATIRIIAQGLATIAEGDLTCRLPEGLPASAAPLKADFDAAAQRLEQLLRHVVGTVDSFDQSARDMATASGDLAARTAQQADGTVKMHQRLEAITAIGRQNAGSTQRAADITASTRSKAESSGQVIRDAVGSMARIEEQSRQIERLTALVSDIGTQTTMLALNALLEAARAGEAGQGFAVVAKEVSMLSARLKGAAEDIQATMLRTRECVADGVDLVGRAGQAFAAITQEVSEIEGLARGMAVAAHDQSSQFIRLTDDIRMMSDLTEGNAAMARTTKIASGVLMVQAQSLDRAMTPFRIGRA